jgi:hypothetical protein
MLPFVRFCLDLPYGNVMTQSAPRDYVFVGTQDSGTLGQCNSPLSLGQVLTYVNLSPSPHTTTANISAEGASVYAVQVNGYNFAPSSTIGSSTTLALPTTTAPTGSLTASQKPSSGGLSTGAKTAIGVSLGAVSLCVLFFALFCIRRHRRKAYTSVGGIKLYGMSPKISNGIIEGENRTEAGRSELEQPTPIHRYELAGTPK